MNDHDSEQLLLLGRDAGDQDVTWSLLEGRCSTLRHVIVGSVLY